MSFGWGVSEILGLMRYLYGLHEQIEGANHEIDAAVSDVRRMEKVLRFLHQKVGRSQSSVKRTGSKVLSFITDEFHPLKHDLNEAIGLIEAFKISVPLFYIMFKMPKLRAIRQSFCGHRENLILALSLINTDARCEFDGDIPAIKAASENPVEDVRHKIKERSLERNQLEATANYLTEKLELMGPSAIETVARSGNEDLVDRMKTQLHDRNINQKKMEEILSPLIEEIRYRSIPSIEFVNQETMEPSRTSYYIVSRNYQNPEACRVARSARFYCDRCNSTIAHGTSFYHCPTCLGGEFDVCMSCYGRGQRCFGEGHQLIKSYRYLLVREPNGGRNERSPSKSRSSTPSRASGGKSSRDSSKDSSRHRASRSTLAHINTTFPRKLEDHCPEENRERSRSALEQTTYNWSSGITQEQVIPRRARSHLRSEDASHVGGAGWRGSIESSGAVYAPPPRPHQLTGAPPLNSWKPKWIMCVDGSNGIRSIVAHVYLELLRAWTANTTGQWLFDRVDSAGVRVYTEFIDSAISAEHRLSLPGNLPNRNALNILCGPVLNFWSEDFPREKFEIFNKTFNHRSRGIELRHFQEFSYFICFNEEVQDRLLHLRDEVAYQEVGTMESQIVLLQGCSWYHKSENYSKQELEEIVRNVQEAVKQWLWDEFKWRTPSVGMAGGINRTLHIVLEFNEAAKLASGGWRYVEDIEERTGCKIRMTREGTEGRKLVTATGPRTQLNTVKRDIERCFANDDAS